MVKSNYEILSVPEGASRNEIRSAFRTLALKHHADRCCHDEEFIIIKQAFEDLKVGKKYPDSLDEKQRKSKFFWGTDEEERLRHNTLLSNDVAQEIKVAQEWIDASSRTDVTGIRLFGSNELGQIEIERKPTNALSIKGKFWAGKISHSDHIFMWGSMTSPYFSDNEDSKTLIHLTKGTFKLMEPLENGYNIENGSHIIVDNGDIVCGNVNGIRQQVPHPTGRVGMSLIKEHFTKLEAPKGKIIAGDVRETVLLDAEEVLVLNLVDNVIVKGKKIFVFGPKVSYDVLFELKEGGVIRFYDKGSGFDISDDAILKLENGKEFFLDDLKTKKLIGFGGQDMTYEFLDNLEESSGVLASNWVSKLSGMFKKK